MTKSTKKKYVTRELIDYHLPDPGELIVQVIRGCGNNLHEVQTPEGEQFLVSMPTKFRRSVWIKRGDYLIVTPIEEGNKVRAEIHSILFKDHVCYLKEQDKWPKAFDTPSKYVKASKGDEDSNKQSSQPCYIDENDYDDDDDNDDDGEDLVSNTN